MGRYDTPWRASFPWIWSFAVRMEVKSFVSQLDSQVLLSQPSPTMPQPPPNRWQQLFILSMCKPGLCAKVSCFHMATLVIFFLPNCSKPFCFQGKCSLIKIFQYLGCSWSIMYSSSSFLLTASALLMVKPSWQLAYTPNSGSHVSM